MTPATVTPANAPSTAPKAAPAKKPLSLPITALLLLLFTALAAFLRYWRIDFQSYWTDEGYTIERVRGTWQQMLLSLKGSTGQGFPPGWYALLYYWCHAVENVTHNGALAFSSLSTRSLTALFGTLTVPAMFALARHFADRRGALLVTLLAAVNPFLIYYARDIKMYAPFYFFVVLNMAMFFNLLQSRGAWRLLWFPLLALTGAAMTALHPMAWFILILQLLFLLTRPRPRGSDAPLWVLSTAAACAFPLYWYDVYLPPTWIGRVSATQNMGMGWLTRYTDMNWQTLASLPTEHLNGYLWPVNPPDAKISSWFMLGADFPQHLATRTSDLMARSQLYIALAFFTILLLGLIPWRGLRKNPERLTSVTRGRWWWIALWIALPMLALWFTWQPRAGWFYNEVWHKMSPTFDPKPLWEPRYLGIVVPAWILWMASSLRRLPTWPVRALATLFVVAASVFSSLSNHLIYRNAPINRVAAIAQRFTDASDPESIAIALPETQYAQPVLDVEYAVARNLRPGSAAERRRTGDSVFFEASDDSEYVSWLREQIQNPRIRTIVLTDRSGDIVDPGHPLSNPSLERLLGTSWTRIDQEFYAWHYEWRFYIFHTWRTRVWQRVGPPPSADPQPSALRPAQSPSIMDRLRSFIPNAPGSAVPAQVPPAPPPP